MQNIIFISICIYFIYLINKSLIAVFSSNVVYCICVYKPIQTGYIQSTEVPVKTSFVIKENVITVQPI